MTPQAEPIHLAARYNSAVVLQLLVKYGAVADTVGDEGESVVHYAARGDAPATLALLLGNMAIPVDTRTGVGDQIIHIAAVSNAARAMRLLLQRGAAANVANNKGSRPLHLASGTLVASPHKYSAAGHSSDTLFSGCYVRHRRPVARSC